MLHPTRSLRLASLAAICLLLAFLILSTFRQAAQAQETQPTIEATPAYCGGVYLGDTSNGSQQYESYTCRPDWPETGPEQIYRLKTTYTQPLTLTLSYSSSIDLDLFVLGEDDPTDCQAADAVLTLPDLPPGDHLIIVDGYAGQQGPYALTVDCSQAPLATATPTPTQLPTFTPTPTPPRTPTPTPTASATRPRLSYSIYLPHRIHAYPPPTPQPQQIVLQPIADNDDSVHDSTLSAWEPTENYGKLDRLLLRQPDVMAPVIRFDLSAVPANAHIVNATLSLYAISQSNDNPAQAGVYRLNQGWDEDNVSWQMATVDTAWQEPGANAVPNDREATARDIQRVVDTQRFYDWDITALVQEWLFDPSAQHGVVLKAFDVARVQYAFASSEYPNPAARPKLTISYWIPSPYTAREQLLP